MAAVRLGTHLSHSTCDPPTLAPLAEEEERRTGDREITYLVVLPFLMTLALHLWGGLPVDLERVKGQTAMLSTVAATQSVNQWCSIIQGS